MAPARDSGNIEDAEPARRRGRQYGKVAVDADDMDAASKPVVEPLSPAQLAEAVQDKAVAS